LNKRGNPQAPIYYPVTENEGKMHQSTHFSALSSAILLLAKGIDSYGLDSAELFAKAGLDHSRLKDPLARFSF
jgi:hypothetical protein